MPDARSSRSELPYSQEEQGARENAMIEIRLALPAIGAIRRVGVPSAALLMAAVACSGGDRGAAATPVESPDAAGPASDAPSTTAVDPAESAAVSSAAPALDFGSGTGSITVGDETFELAVGPGTGLCRDVFGMIQAGGQVADGRDIRGDFSIPPLDWETYSDGRYDPPSVELEITSTGPDNADWRADAAWAQENDKVGKSQVDSYQKDGLTASGSATFANAWDPSAASVQGTFEISCAEG
jgi:hypothetical protein